MIDEDFTSCTSYIASLQIENVYSKLYYFIVPGMKITVSHWPFLMNVTTWPPFLVCLTDFRLN